MTDSTTGIPRSENPVQPSHLPFPVVGIGASAGGLVALRQLLEQTPADCDMAFVVIMHLSPSHESYADSVLQRCTKMPVTQVRERTAIERNHVYVISPTVEMTMSDGMLEVRAQKR